MNRILKENADRQNEKEGAGDKIRVSELLLCT